jgi:cytosine/adenosine deaminase-related metal-dependent hydrolase
MSNLPDDSYSLGARWIFTMSENPLENHWINVTQNIVESISSKPANEKNIPLGKNSVVLPAAVNLHAHLELSIIETPLDVPSRTMSDWVAQLLAFRRSSIYDAQKSIRQAMCRPEFLSSTAAVADIVPSALPVADLNFTTPAWLPFAELIAWRPEQVKAKIAGLDSFYGVSPHAPQTVCPDLLNEAVKLNVPIAMHLAETQEELQLLRNHSGSLLEMMRRADPDYDPKSVLLGKRPMDYLRLLSAAPKVFIIHGNYLDDEEFHFLAEYRETMAVVYCPRSHAYFRHTPFLLQKMLDYGVRVLLGTDSLASVPDLSMIEEIKFAAANHPSVPAETIYRLGTFDGAAALDLPQFGAIQKGKPAKFAVL